MAKALHVRANVKRDLFKIDKSSSKWPVFLLSWLCDSINKQPKNNNSRAIIPMGNFNINY